MEVGLYGKLPSHGDFLRRRTSDAFVGAWDRWLQASMAASRSALGDRWLDVYLTSPAWRFAAAPGACGSAPLVGLMAPSVDRVGRCFPLTIVAEVPAHASPIVAAMTGAAFFDRAERLVIETLEAERVDFEAFDERVAGLAGDLSLLAIAPRVLLEEDASAVLAPGGEPPWQVPLGTSDDLPSALAQLLARGLAGLYDPLTLWWTDGSSIVEPSCLVVRGLPQPEAFAALLDGSWADHWRSVSARVEAPPALEPEALTAETPMRFRSAAASDVGKVRAINQDSFIECPDSGLWAVADGVGGHSNGETASRMVCDALADFQQTGSFDETIEAASERVRAVNDQLVRAAARSLLGDRSGSTVVALLTRGSRLAVIWAGDSRAYRLRGGRLERLTRDHSVAEAGIGAPDSHAITRAVGAQPRLDLEVCRERAEPGDRYLLCSDGLSRMIPDARIRSYLEAPEIEAAARGLVDATLEAGAPDNVTALVVEASGDAGRGSNRPAGTKPAGGNTNAGKAI